MAFTEFYVTKTSALNLHGGSSEALIDNPGDVTAVHDGAGVHTLTDNGVDGFSNTQVDDFICWDTAGAAEYARVTAVTSSDIIVVLNMVGAVAFTGLENKAVNVGGPWATVHHLFDTMTTSFVNAAGDVPRGNVKYSATSYDEYITPTWSGTATVPLTFEGYYSTPGDDCMNGATWSPPEIDGTGQTGLALYYSVSKDYVRIGNMWMHTPVSGDHCLYFNTGADNVLLFRLRLSATGAGGYAIDLNTADYVVIRDCWIEDSASHGIYCSGGGRGLIVEGCLIESAGGYGVYHNGTIHSSFTGTTITGSADDCIYFASYHGVVDHCILHGSTGGSGIKYASPGSSYAGTVRNSILYGNNQYGIEIVSADVLHTDYNAYGGNGVAATLNHGVVGPHAVTLTGDPFTNAAGGDFSLNNTAGAGAACRNAGFPGAMIDGTNEGFADIGALRHEDPAGGGGLAKLVGFGGGLVG